MFVFLQKSWFTILIPYAPCMVYLPTKLGDFVRANVGIHIPAPWFAYGICFMNCPSVSLLGRRYTAPSMISPTYC